jgi:hypothetical protein
MPPHSACSALGLLRGGEALMLHRFAYLLTVGFGAMLASSAFADTIYNNLTPNNMMAIATRPESGGNIEIETGDDFVVSQQTAITSATFVGMIVPGPSGTPDISDVVAEMYRVFPLDSNTARTRMYLLEPIRLPMLPLIPETAVRTDSHLQLPYQYLV